jgi:hypothetical protein
MGVKGFWFIYSPYHDSDSAVKLSELLIMFACGGVKKLEYRVTAKEKPPKLGGL